MFNDVFIIVSDTIFHVYVQFRLNTFKYSFEYVFLLYNRNKIHYKRLIYNRVVIDMSTNL